MSLFAGLGPVALPVDLKRQPARLEFTARCSRPRLLRPLASRAKAQYRDLRKISVRNGALIGTRRPHNRRLGSFSIGWPIIGPNIPQRPPACPRSRCSATAARWVIVGRTFPKMPPTTPRLPHVPSVHDLLLVGGIAGFLTGASMVTMSIGPGSVAGGTIAAISSIARPDVAEAAHHPDVAAGENFVAGGRRVGCATALQSAAVLFPFPVRQRRDTIAG